jgi:hypothetical protein
MSARLEHEQPAKAVAVAAQPLQLLGHGAPGNRRRTAHNQAQRLAGNLRVDRFDMCHRNKKRPAPAGTGPQLYS